MNDENGNDILAGLFAKFTEETGINVEINYIARNDWADYITKVQTLYASGKAPDLVYVPAEAQAAFLESNMLQPIDSYLEANPEFVEDYEANVAPALRAIPTVDGKVYGCVNNFETTVMWLNMDILAEAGLEKPDANWTWDEFETYCQTIVDKTDKFAFCIPTSYFTSEAWYYSFGTSYLNDDMTEVTFGSPESRELMQFWMDAYEKGWCPGDPFNMYDPNELAAGRVAMVSSGRWAYSSYYAADLTNVAAVNFPVKNSDAKVLAWSFLGVSSETEHFDEAAQLACYWVDKEFDNEYLRDVDTCIPARSDLNNADNYLFDFAGQDIMYSVPDSAKGMEGPTCYADFETIWKATVTSVLSGQKTVDGAVDDAVVEMQTALQ